MYQSSSLRNLLVFDRPVSFFPS